MEKTDRLIFIEWPHGGTPAETEVMFKIRERLRAQKDPHRVSNLNTLFRVTEKLPVPATHIDIIGHGNPGTISVGWTFDQSPQQAVRYLSACPTTLSLLIQLRLLGRIVPETVIRLIGCDVGLATNPKSDRADGPGALAMIARSLLCTIVAPAEAIEPAHFDSGDFDDSLLPMVRAEPDGRLSTSQPKPVEPRPAALETDAKTTIRIDSVREVSIRHSSQNALPAKQAQQLLACFDLQRAVESRPELLLPTVELDVKSDTDIWKASVMQGGLRRCTVLRVAGLDHPLKKGAADEFHRLIGGVEVA